MPQKQLFWAKIDPPPATPTLRPDSAGQPKSGLPPLKTAVLLTDSHRILKAPGGHAAGQSEISRDFGFSGFPGNSRI